MSKSDPSTAKKQRNKTVRWVLIIFAVTIVVSALISLISEEVMANSGIGVAFVILFAIVFIGIIFDIIGVSVTSADETPFHAMASRKVPGAKESIRLLRQAEKVSSICNDVVGDICGVVSGSASAVIAAQEYLTFPSFQNITCVSSVASVIRYCYTSSKQEPPSVLNIRRFYNNIESRNFM